MRHHLPSWACALALTLASQAHATTVSLAADGQWRSFTVDTTLADSAGLEWIDADNTLDPGFGSPLEFAFTIDAGQTGQLTVVDLAFAGDRFSLSNFGASLGTTAAVAAQTLDTAPFEFDPDAALAQPAFSSASFTLGSGSYLIGGLLIGSVLDSSGAPLNATAGALRLSVTSPIPEPDTVALYAAGLLALGVALRRRTR